MLPLSNSLTATLLGVAVSVLALGLLVQVIQEVNKFLTSSRARTYARVLEDMFGPWVMQLTRDDLVPDLEVRKPFQFMRIRPQGILLPQEKASLISALERTAPAWIYETLKHLNHEAIIQHGQTKAMSPRLAEYLRQLASAAEQPLHGSTASNVIQFLSSHNVMEKVDKDIASADIPAQREQQSHRVRRSAKPIEVDAKELLSEFRLTFLPHVTEVERDFAQLMRNFEYSYRRRNLRYTIVIALCIAILCDLPFEHLYEKARRMSTNDVILTLDRLTQLQVSHAKLIDEIDARNLKQLPARQEADRVQALVDAANEDLKILETIQRGDQQENGKQFSYFASPKLGLLSFSSVLRYLFGCLITAILSSFAAPFWNDIGKSLLSIQQRRHLTAVES